MPCSRFTGNGVGVVHVFDEGEPGSSEEVTGDSFSIDLIEGARQRSGGA